ncbi:MAG: hypothetical protein ACXAEU_24580, partial [Candidatus Hodarchaeales archaeon]
SRALSGDNNFLAIAKMERGVSFVDVSDPTKPHELALYNEIRPSNCLYDGKYVYITAHDTSRSFQIVEFITEESSNNTLSTVGTNTTSASTPSLEILVVGLGLLVLIRLGSRRKFE